MHTYTVAFTWSDRALNYYNVSVLIGLLLVILKMTAVRLYSV